MSDKAIKVLSTKERFKRTLVWHPLNTDPEDDDRSGPRFWFPTYDLFALALGIYAMALGSPLLNRLFPDWFTNIMGLVFISASIMCLVGVLFPRFNLLELIGKLFLVFLLGGYAGTVGFRSSATEPNGFVVIVLIMSVWLLGPRITKLFIQVGRVRARQRDKKV